MFRNFMCLAIAFNLVSSALELRMSSSREGRAFRNLKPLPCTGVYSYATDKYSSFFLSPVKLTVEEMKNGKMIAMGKTAVF